MIVVDASVILELLIGTADADRVARRVLDAEESLHAPHLLDVECAHVLRRYAARREISPEHGTAALALLAEFPIRRHAHTALLGRMWELRHILTGYDAAYVALAEGLGATLLTRDQRLAAARTPTARVQII